MISFFSVLMWFQLVLSSLSPWEVSPECQQSLPIARTNTEVSASDLASVSPLDSREILEQYKSHRGWEQGTQSLCRVTHSRQVWLPCPRWPRTSLKIGVRWWQKKKNQKNNSHHLSSSFLKSQSVCHFNLLFKKYQHKIRAYCDRCLLSFSTNNPNSFWKSVLLPSYSTDEETEVQRG